MSDKAVLLSIAVVLLIAGPSAEPRHLEQGAGCAPVPGMDILGHGYDVFGEYASQSSLKPYDLFVWRNFREEGEPPGCYRTPEFFRVTRLGRTNKREFSYRSKRDYSETLAAYAKLGAKAFFFKASVESRFASSKDSGESFFYTTIMDVKQMFLLHIDTRKNGHLEALDPAFRRDLEDPKTVPEELFATYGTHYVASAIVGARADFTATTRSLREHSEEDVRVKVAGQYGAFTGAAALDVGKAEGTDEANTTTELRLVGGGAHRVGEITNAAQYKAWTDGIETAAPVLVDFDDESLRPIWELTSDERRVKELKKAFERLCEMHPLPPKREKRPEPSAVANPAVLENGTYVIRQAVNGRFLDAYANAKNDYRVVTRGQQNDGSQSWILTRAEGATYTIKQQLTGRFLDAYDNARNDYRAVTRTSQDDRSQHWILTRVKEDTYTLRQDLGRRLLDAYTNSLHDYEAVTRGQQNDDSQLWRLTRTR